MFIGNIIDLFQIQRHKAAGGECLLMAEAVSKRMKKSFETHISPHVYEKAVGF
jgi:hypothetical protein